MNHPKFVIFRNKNGMFYYRLYNEHQKILMTGLPCQHRNQCIMAIQQLYGIVQKDHHYRMQTIHGQFYYQVTNEEHTIIGTSVMYRTMTGMAYGINGVKQNVVVAVIQDHSTIEI